MPTIDGPDSLTSCKFCTLSIGIRYLCSGLAVCFNFLKLLIHNFIATKHMSVEVHLFIKVKLIFQKKV